MGAKFIKHALREKPRSTALHGVSSRDRGTLISFEGPDGCGKSTQVRLLEESLRADGYPVLVTREPGGTRMGKILRSLVLNPKNVNLSQRAELFLYLADRAQHVHEVVAPALMLGKIVLVDRYMDSTWVYQGMGRGLPLGFIESCNLFAVAGMVPHLTLVFDVSAQVGLARVGRGKLRRDRMEAQSIAFHRRVCSGFRRLKKRFGSRVVILNANAPIQKIHAEVQKIVHKRLGGTIP